ncbi:27227_t:CDS:1, partial [Gigaspora margarita]
LDIDSDIKILLNNDEYQLVWIPYHQFTGIEKIGSGGFADVYLSTYHRVVENVSDPEDIGVSSRT